jgi:hypothetical protein
MVVYLMVGQNNFFGNHLFVRNNYEIFGFIELENYILFELFAQLFLLLMRCIGL